MDIVGTTALVTGAGSGIGQALARLLAEAGSKRIIIVDIAEDRLLETAAQITAAGGEAVIRPVDLTESRALAALFADPVAQDLDIVCNNAGIVSGEPGFPDTSIEKIETLVALNFTAVALGTQYAVKIMQSHGRGGAVINTSSITALTPSLRNPVYAGTKAGVVMLTRSLAALKDSDNIRVNAICPAIVGTRLTYLTGADGAADWMLKAMESVKVLPPEVPALAALELIRDDTRSGEAVVFDNEPA